MTKMRFPSHFSAELECPKQTIEDWNLTRYLSVYVRDNNVLLGMAVAITPTQLVILSQKPMSLLGSYAVRLKIPVNEKKYEYFVFTIQGLHTDFNAFVKSHCASFRILSFEHQALSVVQKFMQESD